MITPDKIRAACGFLDWTHSDLEKKSGISMYTIRNIIAGDSKPRQQTMQMLETAFNQAGIVFTENGVEKKADSVVFIEGADCYIKLLKIVMDSDIKEVLCHCADDRRSPTEVDQLVAQMTDKGIRQRYTICEGNTFIKGDIKNYRWIPKNYYATKDVSLVFGDRVGYFQPPPSDDTQNWNKSKIILLRNTYLADTARRDFEYFWNIGKIPTLGE